MNPSDAGKRGYEKTRHILEKQGEERTRNAIERYEVAPKHCLYCGEKIVFERRRAKFCNSSCSASYNNQGRNRHTNRIRLMVRTEVCSCGKPKLKRNKYCDECATKHVYQRKDSTVEARTDRTRKRILTETRGYRCEVCGISRWMEMPIKLEIDHIDGNSDNNDISNLRLLCPNCHSLTETYKTANMGKNSSRQQMRRKRYAEGKTY